MMTATTPEPQQVRAEIAQNRAALGVTVQALAAMTDVKARAKRAAGDATGGGRLKLTIARARAGHATATARDQLVTALPVARRRLSAWKEQAVEMSRRPTVRPVALAVAAAVLVGAVVAAAARK